ncbi:MFS transporter [Elioraea sp.]|uniref:MFS transporter n=1 Tax=Elioraea sp. TaxID=2185103 RepID=UPI003F70C286
MSADAPESIGRLFRRISLPLAAGAALNQLNRAITAVIAPDIADVFALSAADLGFLGAVFFAAYGIAQLPVGAALDRYGPRRVQAALMLAIAAGALVFAASGGLGLLVVGRVLLGVGVSAALMAQLKATREWFPASKVAAVAGWCVGLSALGGVVATVPAEALRALVGWRGVFVVNALIALAAGWWIWRSVPETLAQRSTGGLAEEIRVVGRIMVHPSLIRLMPVLGVMSALNFTWQGLWAGPWLRDVAGLDAIARAQVLLVYALGLTVGSFFSGSVQAALVRRGAHPLALIVGCTVALLVLHVLLIMRVLADVPWLWFLWPFFASPGPVGYTLVSARFPAHMTGRVSTTMNGLMLVLVFISQHGIGLILDLWPRTEAGGWDPRGYDAAIAVSAAIQAASLIWLFVRREAASDGGDASPSPTGTPHPA